MSEEKPLAESMFCPAVLGVSTVPINEKGDLVLDSVPGDLKVAVLESFYQTYPSKKPLNKTEKTSKS